MCGTSVSGNTFACMWPAFVIVFVLKVYNSIDTLFGWWMQCGTLFKRLRRRQCGPKCRVILVRRRYYHRRITLQRGNTRYYTTLHNINITRYQQRTYHSVPTLSVGQDNTSWGSEDSEEKQAHQLSSVVRMKNMTA